MTPKRIIAIALLTATFACGGQAAKDTDQTNEATASFTDMDEDQLLAVYAVSTGLDLLWDAYPRASAIASDESRCVAVTEVEGGVEYQGIDKPGCNNDELKGTLTVYGVDAPGGWQDNPHGDISLDFDNVEFPGEDYFANGTVSFGPTSPGHLPSSIEADLEHLPFSFEVVFESHVRMQQEGKNAQVLEHGPGSWAAIDGVGSFDLSGTVNWNTGEMDLELTGTDSLRFHGTVTGLGCIAYTIDGTTDELCVH